MRTRMTLITIVLLAAVTVLLVTGSMAGGPPTQDPGTAGVITLSGTVASKISYQGRLTDAGGNPLSGSYNLVFQLWDDATAGSQLGAAIVKNNVPVSNGLFTVGLDVPQEAFNGQALWLRVQVNGEWLSPRQELLPVPYALTLRPGAFISSSGPTALNLYNEAGGYSLEGWSQNNIGLLGISWPGMPLIQPSGMHGVHGVGDGVGVYGEGGHTGAYGWGANDGVKGESTDGRGVHGRSDNNDGVVGWTGASDKSGVFGNSQVGTGVAGRSEAASGHGVAGTALGANGRGVCANATGSDGVGVYGRSDLGRGVEGRTTSDNEWVSAIDGRNAGAGDGVYGWSQSRHGTYGATSSQNPEHAGVYGVNHGAGPAMKAEGDLVVTGSYRGNIGPNGGAPFPRPAYDSGWLFLEQCKGHTFEHGLGGNPDNYVVDLQYKGGLLGINRYCYGTCSKDALGVYWCMLTNTNISVWRECNDFSATQGVRIRIWVYR